MQKSKVVEFADLYNRVFWLMLAGCVFYLLALPPTGLWCLGWVAAAFWTPLIRRKTLLRTKTTPSEKIVGNNKDRNEKKYSKKITFSILFWIKNRFTNRPYRQIWLAGVIFWGFAVHWVCFPHWATCFGWLALCCYLGLYFPLFIFLARVMHRTPVFGRNIPVWLAAPISWLTIDLLKGTLMGGFGFALLAHSQYQQTHLIQIADIGGEALVSAVMIFVGVLLGYFLPVALSVNENGGKTENGTKISHRGKAACAISVAVTFILITGYGKIRESQYVPSKKPPLRAALLQGNYRASLSAPAEWYDEVFENYSNMALEAVKERGDEIDVIIWPESTCIYPWADIDYAEMSPKSRERFSNEDFNAFLSKENDKILKLTQSLGKQCIFGLSSYVYSEKKNDYFRYNSALLIENDDRFYYDSSKETRNRFHYSRYDKMLLVMFGEYIPLAGGLPENFFLKTLCQQADFGREPVNFVIARNSNDATGRCVYNVSANICFESSSSKLVRNQIRTLKDQGVEPEILVNISNDGWFRHSSQIDMHLATHVFRAVENRKPYLAATNGGFSAGIDGSGKILTSGSRNANQVVFFNVSADTRMTYYDRIGYGFSVMALLLNVMMCFLSVWGRKQV